MEPPPEDRVDYWVYPAAGHAESAAATLARAFSLAGPLAARWVWHRQAFSLAVVQEGEAWHLAGTLDFGENVMDEWFVVALLQHITEKIPSLVARVTDTDGEILLIEAAGALPAWAGEPRLAEGRAFLHRGALHLLPVCSSPGTVSPLPAATPRPARAAAAVAACPALTRAEPAVQEAIRARLAGLPADTAANHHRASAVLPAALATMLGRDPGLLGRLVRAVQERDPVDVRACRQMARVPQERLVRCTVTFSRCLYAMLAGAQVRAYRSSGWTVGEDRAEQLGFKLATGLEILLSRCRGAGGRAGDETEFRKFVAKLKDVGFFQGELEGSKKHGQLMEDCRNFWLSSLPEECDDRSITKDYLAARDSHEPPDNFLVGPPGPEDSEDWLEVTPESLDAMLEAQFGVSASGPGQNNQNIPEELSKFLGKISDMAGVEPGEEDGESLLDAKGIKRLVAQMVREEGGQAEVSESEDSESGEEDPAMVDYLDRLDSEVRADGAGRADQPDLGNPEEVDTSVLNNLLKSYSAQAGLGGHGPVSSLLQSLKLNPGRPDGD
jgi:hypothetical protein